MGKHVSKCTVHLLARKDKYCVYWAYRPTHSCPGHFTSTWDHLGTRRHSTPTNRGPLVLGSQAHICSEAAGTLHSWLVSCIFALLNKQSLAFHVCPAAWPTIPCFLFMTISPQSAGLASPCLAPRSHPASIRFSGCLLHCSWGS
ncbi:rCG51914 [Rattus norvegicus]|uniref:RCG51914 n=1 Tax=Rattus norvegicus TaxID=10116 RepID=A6K377_RAT|nr:rCG51914 [Rattus norvegicus]